MAQFAGGLVGSKDDALLQEEIDELFAQPYIDPLTRYLDEHSADERRARELALVAQEREIRCAAIAQIYAGREASQANLQRMRRAYMMSCPEDVQDFAARVKQSATAQLAASSKAPQPSSEPEPEAESEPVTDLDAALEDALARRQNSNCYLLFTIKNYTQAHEACRPIAQSGDARAQHHMASLERTRGKFAPAFSWAERSASQQHPPGLLILGQLYQAGQGTQRDRTKGLELIQRAADLGLTEASYHTGLAYQNGVGVTPAPELADRYLQQAANNGHLPSYLALSSLHEQRNPEAARYWLSEAARKGSPEAQLALADSYATTANAAADHEEAYVWYSLALLNGNAQAKAGVKHQEKLLSADQLASARSRIQDGINGRWN
ncbi:MAG: sel1 repeat family protein [Gammaproteobacteria bacterium]|nr:sel1 repeat family protein [Gammaproteobacteria bacterium]